MSGQADEEHKRSYLEGLRDGQIQQLEGRMNDFNAELKSHESRLRILEKISYAMLGIVGLIQVLPALTAVAKAVNMH
jgi:hypothetical protein